MSRSRKKTAMVTLSKAWNRFKEKSFRRRTRDQLQGMIIDPDKDWEEANFKKLKGWGTRVGFKIDLSPDDSWYKWNQEMKRK